MTTIPAELGSFVVSSSDTALRKRAASSCQPEVTTIWFPVIPGTTDLPISPEPIINASPEAPNSVEAPIDFDPEDPDLCALFNDILPVSSPPIYPVEQTVELLSAPYIETVLVPTITRTRLGVTSINYPLSVDGGSVSLLTKTKLGLVNLYIAAENAIFAFTGNEAIPQRRKTVSPERGYFFVEGFPAMLRRFIGVNIPFIDCSIQALAPRTIPNNDLEILSPVIDIGIAVPGIQVATGSSNEIPAPVEIVVSAEIPSVVGGKTVNVPVANILIATEIPLQVGRPVIITFIPAVDISIAEQTPSVGTGVIVNTPASEVIISGNVPEISTVKIEIFAPASDISILTISPLVSTGTAALVPSGNISVAALTPSDAGLYDPALEEVVAVGTKAPSLGAAGAVHPPTGWTVLQNGNGDDANVQSTGWAFNFTIDSVSYTSAFIGSNSYLTFGLGSNEYSGLSATNPFIRKIHFGSADNSYQRVYTKSEIVDGINVQRIRYEGTAGTSGTLGSPNIVVEFAFCQPFSDGRQLIELRIGNHARLNGVFMIANQTTAYASDTIVANSSWVFIGNSTGTEWTMTANRFTLLYNDIEVYVPSIEVAISAIDPEVEVITLEVFVPAADISISTVVPSLNTNIVLEIPVADLATKAEVPYIELDTYFSSMITQVYRWDRDFTVDWWGD